MGLLERGLEAEVAGAKRQPVEIAGGDEGLDLPGRLLRCETESEPLGAKDGLGFEAHMGPHHMAVEDAAYEGDADDEMLDLGIKLGKMR
jgi:hypothetical protein